jgi:hypothetical protein
MALMTVGAGTLILGRGLIGPAAVGIDWGLWLAGTAAAITIRAARRGCPSR